MSEPVDSPPDPRRIIEALLFVGGPPLTPERATEIVRGLTPDQFRAHVDSLNRDYRRQGRPYQVLRTDAGYSLALRSAYRGIRERLMGSPREARLSQPALDVLALVAYRQPLTKAEIDSQRGVDSGALLRQLQRLGLVTVLQRAEGGGSDTAYGTTPRFLELFGLSGLEDLPRTDDLRRL
jgi:segregation and condensation protein B